MGFFFLFSNVLSSPEAKKPKVRSRQADEVQQTHAEVTLIAECWVLGKPLAPRRGTTQERSNRTLVWLTGKWAAGETATALPAHGNNIRCTTEQPLKVPFRLVSAVSADGGNTHMQKSGGGPSGPAVMSSENQCWPQVFPDPGLACSSNTVGRLKRTAWKGEILWCFGQIVTH